MPRRPASQSVEDKLRITIDTILDAAAEHPEQFRIVFGHGPAFLDLMVRVHEMFIEDLRRDFEPTLGERANAVANLTIGMLSQAVSWLLERTDLPLSEIKELTVNFALGGLGRAAGRRNGSVDNFFPLTAALTEVFSR